MKPVAAFKKRFDQYSKKPPAPPDSSEESSSTLVESVSGKYLELARQGKLSDLVGYQHKRKTLRFELMAVEAELNEINDREALLSFYFQTNGEQFGRKLQRRAEALERKKKRLHEAISAIEKEIRKIDPPLLDIPLKLPPIKANLTTSTFLNLQPDVDPKILLRDIIIQQCARKGFSNPKIIATLDGQLMLRGAPPIGFPDDWVEEYGGDWEKLYPNYDYYLAAYRDRRTKGRMQKMISTAKKRIR